MEQSLEQQISNLEASIRLDQQSLPYMDGQSYYDVQSDINESYAALCKLKEEQGKPKLRQGKIKSRHIRRSLNRNPK